MKTRIILLLQSILFLNTVAAQDLLELQDEYNILLKNSKLDENKSTDDFDDLSEYKKIKFNDSLISIGQPPRTLHGQGESVPIDKSMIKMRERKLLGDILKITLEDDDDIIANNAELSDIDIVTIKEKLNNLFNPEDIACPIPKKILRKLKRKQDKGESWFPKKLQNSIETFDVGYFIEGSALKRFLNTLIVKKAADGKNYKYILRDSDSFKNFDFGTYFDDSTNNFIYTLDCAGYLNASLSAAGGAPGADIESVAKSSLESSGSMFIGGGNIISPIASAYHPSLGIRLDTISRLNILKSLVNLPDLKDSDTIIVPNDYKIIWSSKSGNSSFNGEGSLNVNAGLNTGVVKISGSGSAGGNVSVESSFNSYMIFVVERTNEEEYPGFTVSELKALIATLEK